MHNACMTLREWRKKVGLTQEQLGQRIGVDQSTIARIENGRVDPTLRVARVLHELSGGEVNFLQASAA